MQLVAYFYGIAKDRRLCEEVRYNLAYRWFCRLSLDDDVPDHSSLTRIRDRLGEEVFEAVFLRIVAQCQQKGLVKDPCRVMTDATLIAADAALNSLVHNDPEQAKREAEVQHERRGSIDGRARRKLSNQTHRSRTDPMPRWRRSKEPRGNSCIKSTVRLNWLGRASMNNALRRLGQQYDASWLERPGGEWTAGECLKWAAVTESECR